MHRETATEWQTVSKLIRLLWVYAACLGIHVFERILRPIVPVNETTYKTETHQAKTCILAYLTQTHLLWKSQGT